MFDPQRASRIDRQRKRMKEDTRSVQRNLRTWEDEVEEDEFEDLVEFDAD